MLGGVLLVLVALAVLLAIAVQVSTLALRFYGPSARRGDQDAPRAQLAKSRVAREDGAGASLAARAEPRRPRERTKLLADDSGAEAQRAPVKETQQCQTCRGVVLATATSCRHCGAPLYAVTGLTERAQSGGEHVAAPG